LFTNYSRTVSLPTLAQECLRNLDGQGKGAVRDILIPFPKKPLLEADRVYLTAKLQKFIRYQRLGQAFIDASKMYQAQNLDGLERVYEGLMRPIPGTESRIELTTLLDVIPRSVPWVWRNRLVRGALTIFAGDPGAGKSMAAVDMGARITPEMPRGRMGRVGTTRAGTLSSWPLRMI